MRTGGAGDQNWDLARRTTRSASHQTLGAALEKPQSKPAMQKKKKEKMKEKDICYSSQANAQPLLW